MKLYKRQNAEVSTYLRANKIVMNNPLSGIPDIHIYEEQVLDMAGEVSTRPVTTFSKPFSPTNAATEFPLLNPETLEPTGQTATYLDVYTIMASLYMSLAHARDVLVEPTEEQEINNDTLLPPEVIAGDLTGSGE